MICESFFFFGENSFSPKPNNGGIIKPKFDSITQIQDVQKEQKKLIDDLRKKQWGDLSTGTDEIQIINTQNVDKAKQGLVDLDHELTSAYGLGENGYWNKNRKLDDDVNSIGQQPMTPSQKVVQPTRKPSTSYTPPKSNWEADDWVMRGKQPTPMTVEPETKKTIAERNVTLWQQNHPQKPTDEMFDAQIGYYNNMVTKAQDDYVNSYGQSSKADASEKDWADYSEKVDDYVTQRDAFNRAKMGVDTSAVQGGGGNKSVSLQPKDDEPIYVGDTPKPEEGSDEALGNFLDDMFNDGGEWKPGAEGVTDSYAEGMSFFNGTSVTIDNATKYEAEKKKRADTLTYNPSTDFATLLSSGMNTAQSNLANAKKAGDITLIARYDAEVRLFDTIANMNLNVDPDNKVRYDDMENGLLAAQDLVSKYQYLFEAQQGAAQQQTQGTLDMLNDEIIAINNGMNVVGEAYLDEIDTAYSAGGISAIDRETAYKDHYQSVIDRESLIEIESIIIDGPNLILADVYNNDPNIYGILVDFEVPLYNSEEDAVFAFKKEAMPLQLSNGKEHGAILDSIEMINTDTGETQTYYYYIEVKEGAEGNVAAQAILGMGGGEDRKLLHTHPVTGGWNRNFSGDPENQGIFSNNPDDYKKIQAELTSNFPSIDLLNYLVNNKDDYEAISEIFGEMGDSTVPAWMGYDGIYVVGSGAEVKLYEGFGETLMGNGQNTYGNTKGELSMVSTIDVYPKK